MPPSGGYHRRWTLIGPAHTAGSTGGFDFYAKKACCSNAFRTCNAPIGKILPKAAKVLQSLNWEKEEFAKGDVLTGTKLKAVGLLLTKAKSRLLNMFSRG